MMTIGIAILSFVKIEHFTNYFISVNEHYDLADMLIGYAVLTVGIMIVLNLCI